MTLKIDKHDHVTTITLNRPEAHNAFNEELMRELHQAFLALDKDKQTRAVVLTGAGKSFCAGGDLNYMKSAREKNREQNIDESLAMAHMFETIDKLSKPTVCVVNGPAFGGGVGLVSVCDIVLAHEKAVFSFSEVKLGLNPSVISPYVVRKIGLGQARRYFITAEKITAQQAKQIGLVHEVYPEGGERELRDGILKHLLANGPNAMAQAKVLLDKNRTLSGRELMRFTAEHIADLRASDEAQEGIVAFFEKRKPGWV